MARIGHPRPDLGKLRLALGLTTQEAARRLGVTDSVLAHYESKGYGYDKEHDRKAIDMYIVWAIAAFASDDIYHRYFPTKRNAPVAPDASRVTQKGN